MLDPSFKVFDQSGALKVVTGSSGSGSQGLQGPPGISGEDGEDLFPFFPPPNNYASSEELATTGNIDNLDFGNVDLLRMNNATLSTIRGLKAGRSGQILTIVSIGAGQVDFEHQNAGSTAENRLINVATSFVTSLAAGVGRIAYQYDGTTARWRLLFHDQGAAISYTPTWTGNLVAPTLGNGTLVGSYILKGRFVDVFTQLTLGTTSNLGTSSLYGISLPIPFTGTPPVGIGLVTTNSAASVNPVVVNITTAFSANGHLFGVKTDTRTFWSSTDPTPQNATDLARLAMFNYSIA